MIDANHYPFPKELYDRGMTLGIKELKIRWSWSNDEDCQDLIEVESDPEGRDDIDAFLDEIYEWVKKEFRFRGGDGDEYGENVIIDLANKKISVTLWGTQVVFSEETLIDLTF